ncbi:MAG TPA: hypothetical protein VGH39_17855, partial [Xanthobacteraceae bacterium]
FDPICFTDQSSSFPMSIRPAYPDPIAGYACLCTLSRIVLPTGAVVQIGARQDLDTTLRHLVDHSCRLLLQSHFDEGASRQWLLHMIELGQKSHETSY